MNLMEYNKKIDYLLNILKSTPELVENSITKNNQNLNKRKYFYELKNKIDIFLEGDTDNRFYIIPGLRGVGKTTILFQLYNYLIKSKNINPKQILYLDLDRLKDYGKFNILNYLDLFIKDINEEAYLNRDPIFIFVDESQYSHNWDHVGKIIFDENKNVFLIFTGFDALNLETSMDSTRRSIKKEIYPLNFSEYLNLKYDCVIPNNISEEIFNMIFTGDINESLKIEKDIQRNIYTQFRRDIEKIWQEFIQYGEFPACFNKTKTEIIQTGLDIKNRIIEKDMDLTASFTTNTKQISYSVLNILALQKPGTLSTQKLATTFEIGKTSVNTILDAFRNTQLIFNIEAYGSINKRNRYPKEYYFLSNQIKANIYQNSGQATRNQNEFLGILAENLVASSLFKMKKKSMRDFGIFYDPRTKNNVDFLINSILGEIIPIEVGIGKKNKKQITNAMNHYDSNYGIVISNKTKQIKKENNVIFIPIKTFSLM